MITSRLGRARSVTAALMATAALLGACSSSGTASSADKGERLVGLFRLTPGADARGTVTGTWFRMLQPGGKVASGPYMINANSTTDGGRVTLLRPGTSGGLRTAGYQSQPSPGFDSGGNSVAAAIVAPTAFFGVRFSISTNEIDPQTKTKVPPPTVFVKDGKLTADLSSWAASWNHQNFNQGAPKPVTSTQAQAAGQQQTERVFDWVSQKWLAAAPKASATGAGATGTYDAATKRFVLQWTSYIVGGPFNGFTGVWHLEGVFEPSDAGPAGS